jgi:hypothetical protein
MLPCGTIAQQSALRVCSGRPGSWRIAIPALSHLLHHEQDGPRLLNGFEWALITTGAMVPTVDRLAAIPGGLGAALLELPLRDGGYLLPSWEELAAFSRACTDRRVPLSPRRRPDLGVRPPPGAQGRADRCAGRYGLCLVLQGLAWLAGAVVAGPKKVIAEVRLWRGRHGGTLWTMSRTPCPHCGLREELPRIAEYHERTVEMVGLLAARGFAPSPSARTATPSVSSSRHPARSSPSGCHRCDTCVGGLPGRPWLVVDRVRGGPGDHGVVAGGRRRGAGSCPARLIKPG